MNKRFTPVEWMHAASMYEVNVRQYTQEGSFDAFSHALPRLKEMGIDVLWFMPITPISIEVRQGTLGSYYACSDYKAINPEFGTLEDFKMLVKKAHALGFKVIIDWVANHTGWDHVWSKTNPEFYKKNAAGKFYDSNNWHDVIDLNYYDHAMRREMIAAMEFWVKECDIDGFRCDMAHLVPLDFWRQARVALDAIKPLFWLAESEHVNYQDAFDCLYAWNWMHQTEKFSRGVIDINGLIETLTWYKTTFHPQTAHLFFTANHDENSWNGTEYEKYGDAAKALAVFSCTWNGIPLIYSGQELPNKKRLKFFDKDEIEWTENFELHDFYKTLLNLRKNNPALRGGDINVNTKLIHSNSSFVLAYSRTLLEKEVVVLLNLSSARQEVELRDEKIDGLYRNVFSGETIQFSMQNIFTIDGWDFLVLEK